MQTVPTDSELLASLVRIGRSGAREHAGGAAPELLSDRPRGGMVVRVGDLVVKAHRAGTDAAALAARLRIASHPAATARPPRAVAGPAGARPGPRAGQAPRAARRPAGHGL